MTNVDDTEALLGELDAVLRDAHYDELLEKRNGTPGSRGSMEMSLHEVALNAAKHGGRWNDELDLIIKKGIVDPNKRNGQGYTAEEVVRQARTEAIHQRDHDLVGACGVVVRKLMDYKHDWDVSHRHQFMPTPKVLRNIA